LRNHMRKSDRIQPAGADDDSLHFITLVLLSG
jgi:hypothetical protein